MRRLKLYLDTTIWNFSFAEDAPQYQAAGGVLRQGPDGTLRPLLFRDRARRDRSRSRTPARPDAGLGIRDRAAAPSHHSGSGAAGAGLSRPRSLATPQHSRRPACGPCHGEPDGRAGELELQASGQHRAP